ncbi:MAG: type IX secretion system sortase PorU, partial [Bacteroidota bacterium]
MFRKYGFIFAVLLLPLLTCAGLPHKNISVLSRGVWYKLAVVNSGIHRITFQDLEALGIDMTALDPAKIRLFGNGSGMLPEANAAMRIDDLRENSILVEDGGDGRFNPSDYILFYGESPDKWLFDKNTHLFYHQKNLYSDTTFYFLTVDTQPGLRIQPVESTSMVPNYNAVRFDDYACYEEDQVNLIRSGKEWYGEIFDNNKRVWDFTFFFPHIDSLSPIRLRSYVAAKASVASYFIIICNGKRVDSLRIEPTDPGDLSRFCKLKTKPSVITNPKSDQKITMEYSLPQNNSLGWLNYLEINCVRNLVWDGPQMFFRSTNSYGEGKVTQFFLQKATSAIQVWDITDPAAIGAVQTTLSDSLLKFRLQTDSLRQFVAFDGSQYLPVIIKGTIPNQNLHSANPTNLVIVSAPEFLAQAWQLADFHRQHNDITAQVVTTKTIFNEFACGNPDPTAIRDFMKLLTDKADSGLAPRYLLLLGDGSYDPKNRIPGNNNFVPTFQSSESLSPTASYVTDDYFGIMGDTSGQEANGNIGIGIGRFPVSDTSTAQIMVNKI